MPTQMYPSKPQGSSKSRPYSFNILLLLAPILTASFLLSPMLGSALAWKARDVAAKESPQTQKQRTPERARAPQLYGKLPLRFEANRGQTSREVRFISRGSGYTLFLTPAGALLRLSDNEKPAGASSASATTRGTSTLRLKLAGSNPQPSVVGETELPGRSNYLIGAQSNWLTNVANYEKVRYKSVYPGVDLVYYGNEGRLEYDFMVAPGANTRRIRLRFDGAQSVRVDEQGDLVIKTARGEIRQQKPLAFQETAGGERESVAARYQLRADGQVGINVGAYDTRRALVIDPVLIYSTFLGGGSSDQGQGVAVAPDGSAYVTGSTASSDFPGPSAIQSSKDFASDAFVLKLNPAGNALVYATYLGGNGDDTANAIAIDSSGNAYVAGFTGSGSFPRTVGVFQDAKDGSLDAFVTKLNSTGTALVYSTYLGGNGTDQAFAIAVDAAGAAYVAGSTSSINFTRFPVETRSGNPVLKSTDGAASWSPSASGLTATIVNDFSIANSNNQVIYAATNLGVYKSTDGSASWQLTGTARTSTAPLSTRTVAVDPTNPNIVYAGTLSGSGTVYKSTDGGTLYDIKNTGLSFGVNSLAIDPTTPTTLYAGSTFGIFKSTNGGDSWAEIRNGITGTSPRVNKIVVDPTNPQTVYAGTSRGMYKTTNGGQNWLAVNNGMIISGVTLQILTLTLDPSNTSTLYAAASTFGNGLYKSVDGGASWTSSSNGITVGSGELSFVPTINALLVDPSSPSTVYAATSSLGGVFKTTNGGANWTQANNGLTNKTVFALAARGSGPTTILAGTSAGNDAFVAKFNPAGSQLEYLRLLGGFENEEARGLAVGADGSAYVAGTTASTNFPVASAFQSVLKGNGDAFVTKLNPAGTDFVYSTYLGGTSIDQGFAIAVGPGGEAYVTGAASTDFPLVNAIQPNIGGGSSSFNDVFVTKFAANGQSLVYSTYLGGESIDQGFGIAVGADGSAYVTGSTLSMDFPVVNPASTGSGDDAFVTKINPAGSAFVYSTYLGGYGTDKGNSIAVDGAGYAYVVGNAGIVASTGTSNFPVANALRPTYGGGTTDAFITKIGASFDVGITMTDSPDPVALGSDLTYNINVTNGGELTAPDVVLTDTLPSGATFVSASTSVGSCSGNNSSVTCTLGTLASGAVVQITIVIKPPTVRSITNTASVAASAPDPVPSNNTASVDTLVNFADLSVTGATAYNKVAPGGRINYLFRVANNSGSLAESVTLTDNLPVGTTFVSCSATGGTCGGSGASYTVTFPSLAVGQSVTIVIAASVNASVAEGTTLSNTATVAAATPDHVPGNNSVTNLVTATATPLRQKTNGLVAYSTDRIYTAKADLSQPPTLFPFNTSALFPRWSPDGTRMAFLVTRQRPVYPNDNIYTIEVANADGTGLLTLADNSQDNSYNNRSGFSWSPDGTRIAYVGKDTFIYIANTDGSGFAKLPNSPSQVRDIDWSPDGSRFVFSKDFGEIYVMNLDGSSLTKLVAFGTGPDGQTRYFGPRWSPDMTRILFVQDSNNYTDVFIMNADGTGVQRLLNTNTSSAPAWSPDGTKLAYYSGTEVHVIGIDGANDVTLTTAEGCCDSGSISWQPIPTNTPFVPTGPPPQTYSISGRVTNDINSGPLFFTTVTLSGTRSATINTRSDGEFSFVNLPVGGNYTVTPSSLSYNFNPPSRTYNNLGANQTGADFVGTYIPANITGRVTDNNGNPLSGIKITSYGGYPEGTTFTDSNGFYSFPNVQRFRSYSIYPDPFTIYTFEPNSQFIPNLMTSQVVNFVGTPQANKVISGHVVEAITGTPIAGIQVNLGRDFVAVTQTFTDSNGFFTFGQRPTNHQYSVSIFNHPTYIFEPIYNAPNPFAEIVIPNLTSDQDLTFNGSRRNTVQFTTGPSANEGNGSVEVTITRSGDVTSPATVNYLTTSGTASQASDYTTAAGTLRFAAGQGTRSVKVILTDDAYVEGTESFTMTLDSPVGAQLSTTPTVSISITDNDTAQATTNPIDDARYFVRQTYADFLSREPDSGGLDYWTERITQCGTNVSCINFWRSAVSAAFFIELEFQSTGSFVYRMYKASYGVRPTYGQFTPDRARLVDTSNLEQNKQSFALTFVQRTEFTTRYPLSLDGPAFVDALLQSVQQSSGVNLSSQRDALIAVYNNAGGGNNGRAAVLRAVADNPTFTQAEYNKAFVLMQYFGFLKRNPDDGGYQFWLNVVNNSVPNDPSGYRSMVCAFITSPEYQQRFSAVVTRNDTVCAPQ